MTGRESARCIGLCGEPEVLEVIRCAELVVAVHVAVVHQHPAVGVDEPEHTRALYGFGGLLELCRGVAPLASGRSASFGREARRHDLAYSARAFVLVEHMVFAVGLVEYYVAVDGRRAAVVEVLRLGHEVGEVIVGIGIVHLVVRTLAVVGQQRVVDEEASPGAVGVLVVGVPYGLGRPYAGHVLPLGEAVGEVHGRVRPVHQVLALVQHHAAVRVPAFARLHVGGHHVEAAVRSAEDVRVADAFLDCYRIGVHHAPAVVEGSVLVAVRREGIVEVLVAVRGEIDEEIRVIVLAVGDVDGEVAADGGLSAADGGRQCDFVLLGTRVAQTAYTSRRSEP